MARPRNHVAATLTRDDARKLLKAAEENMQAHVESVVASSVVNNDKAWRAWREQLDFYGRVVGALRLAVQS